MSDNRRISSSSWSRSISKKLVISPVDLIGCPYNPAPIVQRYTKGAGEKVDQVRKVGRKIVVEVF